LNETLSLSLSLSVFALHNNDDNIKGGVCALNFVTL
jgi:hypothetical protein